MSTTRNTLRIILLAALLLAGVGDSVAFAGAGPTICDSISATLISSKTTTKVISLANGQKIFICGAWAAFKNGTNTSVTVEIESGTQTTTPCDTGTATITGTMSVGSPSAASFFPRILIYPTQPAPTTVAASTDVCVVTGGTTVSGLNVFILYAQHA